MVDPTTLDILGSSIARFTSSEKEDTLALVIAWAAAEPHRVGEVALMDADSGTLVLGRGDSAGSERIRFYRQRPGIFDVMPPLMSPGLSREQLRIRLEDGRLHIERIGKCAMEVHGERVDRAILGPGDTLLLKGQLLLFCTLRPYRMRPLRSTLIAPTHTFGDMDAHGIVGESPATWHLRDQLAWLGQVDEHTLVCGGSGAGKELCARAVHALSSRAAGPFIARNAATIPHSLIDAELFGNVKGYPNPGMPERPGLIGAADRGTLFLDEIGELPQNLQANLLRVLDESGEYHRLGASAATFSNFRLLGATNRDPGELKHDLAARLVLRMVVPGLNERREDIPLLVNHLLRRAAEKNPEATRRFGHASGDGTRELRVKARLIEYLLRYPYRTNIRELDALLWQAMSASAGDSLDWPDNAPKLPSSSKEETAVQPAVEMDTQVSDRHDSAIPSDENEPAKAQIQASLKEHGGNIVRTARALGLSSRYVLYRLMRKYGIEG